jgi:hypothetical protein
VPRGDLNGIAVAWSDLPGDVSASLVFGVGLRDEGVDRIGLSHLVQALVLDAVSSESDHPISLVDTSFVASGPPDDVAGLLEQYCAALTDLQLGRLGRVANRIDPSDLPTALDLASDSCRDAWGSLLARRLGATGAGATRWPARPYGAFTVDEVRDHATRYFHAGNAALGLNRAPWPGLDLRLPPGSRVAHEPLVAREISGWYADEVVAPGFALSVDAASAPVAMVLLGVLERRIMIALDRAGHRCFSIEWSTPVSPSALQVGMSLEYYGKHRDRDSARAASILWEQLRRFAAEPTSPEEISHAIDWHGTGTANGLANEAKALLFSPIDDFGVADAEAARALTPEEIRAAVSSWLGSAMVVVPTGVSVDLPGLARLDCPVGTFTPSGQVLSPSLWRRRRRDERLILGDDAIHHIRDGAVHSVRLADAMLVERGDEVLLGNVQHGCLTDVTPFGSAKRIGARLPELRRRTAL